MATFDPVIVIVAVFEDGNWPFSVTVKEALLADSVNSPGAGFEPPPELDPPPPPPPPPQALRTTKAHAIPTAYIERSFANTVELPGWVSSYLCNLSRDPKR
jgi:hypothetical protein